jgi:hypothetical protein
MTILTPNQTILLPTPIPDLRNGEPQDDLRVIVYTDAWAFRDRHGPGKCTRTRTLLRRVGSLEALVAVAVPVGKVSGWLEYYRSAACACSTVILPLQLRMQDWSFMTPEEIQLESASPYFRALLDPTIGYRVVELGPKTHHWQQTFREEPFGDWSWHGEPPVASGKVVDL